MPYHRNSKDTNTKILGTEYSRYGEYLDEIPRALFSDPESLRSPRRADEDIYASKYSEHRELEGEEAIRSPVGKGDFREPPYYRNAKNFNVGEEKQPMGYFMEVGFSPNPNAHAVQIGHMK